MTAPIDCAKLRAVALAAQSETDFNLFKDFGAYVDEVTPTVFLTLLDMLDAKTGDAQPAASVAKHMTELRDAINDAMGGWSGELVDRIEKVLDQYLPLVDCGACPGDGSVCLALCKLSSESPIAAAPPLPAAQDTRGWKGLVVKAQEILAAHLPPGGPSEKSTISALLGLLDGPEYRAVRDAAAVPAIAQDARAVLYQKRTRADWHKNWQEW